MKTIFSILLSVSYLLSSELHVISGSVITVDGKPISNVNIKVKNQNIWTTTDASGYFTLELPNPQPYDITFEHIAYASLTRKLDSRTKNLKIITLKLNSLPNDEVVITATRKETTLKDAPILTHVINQEKIKETSYSTLEELIEFAMPNVQSTHDSHGGEKIKIQGMDSKYIIFLIDGNPISGEFAGNIDFSLFDIDNIDKIEIIRGGLSTVYGSGAMGGVVNIITKKREEALWANLNSFYDHPKVFSNGFNAGFKFKKLNYYININSKRSDGYDLTEDDFDSGGTFEINKTLEEYSSISINQRIQYNINNNSFLNLSYKNYRKDITKYEFINGFIYQQTQLPNFDNNLFTLNYINNLKTDSSLEFLLQNESHLKSYYFPYYHSTPPSATNQSPNTDGSRFDWSTPKTSKASILYDFEIKNHSLLIGLDYSYQSYESKNILDETNSSILVQSIFGNNDTKSMQEASIFILDNYNCSDITKFHFGLRLNYHSNYNIKMSPSISVKSTPKNYTYRLNFSQSYRSPTLKELYYNFGDHPGGFPILGNENLKPSSSEYYGFSIESRKYADNSLELYYNHANNMIANKFQTLDDEVVYRYHNYKKVDLYGANLNLSFDLSKRINLKSVYSYTDARSPNKDVLDGISAHSLNIKLKYDIYEKMSLILSSKYNSNKTVDVSLEDENNLRTEMKLPEYSISNISIIKNLNKGNYIKLGIKNIFNYIDSNAEAPDFLSSYEPGRHFFISINFNMSKVIK